MKNTLIIFLLSASSVLHAQMSDSLLKYYSYINKAQIAVCDSNYDNARELYNTGFQYKKHPFGIDVYNLAVIYALQNTHNKVYENLKILANMSYPVERLNNEIYFKAFHSFYESKYGKRLLKYAKKPKFSYNIALRKTYDSLLVVDQYFRIKKGSYKVYGDTIYKIDESILKITNDLIKKYGFPSEELVGTYFGFSYNPIKIIILHNNPTTAKPKTVDSFDYKETLLKAINSGAIYNMNGAMLIEDNLGYDFYGISLFCSLYQYSITPIVFHVPKMEEGVYGFSPIRKEDEEEINGLNIERKKIGLLTIEEKRRLLSLPLHSNFNMRGTWCSISMTKEQYEKKLETIIQVK